MPLRDKPLVSIIGSVYNGEEHIAETLQSLRNQDYEHFEVIIVNDASTDNSLSIMEDFCQKDQRFKLITNAVNQGPAAKNIAIKEAKGDFIAVFDADDIYASSRLSEQVKFLQERPELLACSCQAIKFGSQNGLLWNYLSADLLKAFAYINMPLVHPGIMYRAEVFHKHALSYTSSIRFVQDYDLVYRLSQIGKIANQAKVLMSYRRHDKQVTSGNKLSYVERAYDHLFELKSRQLSELIGEHSKEDVDRFILFCFNDLENVDLTKLDQLLIQIIKSYSNPKLMNQVVAQHRIHQLKQAGIPALLKGSLKSPVIKLRHILAYLIKEWQKKRFKQLKANQYFQAG